MRLGRLLNSPLRSWALLLALGLTLSSLTLAEPPTRPLPPEGNGGIGPGGGDFDAQAFVSMGQEIADSIERLRKRDATAGEKIDLVELRKALKTVTVTSLPGKSPRLKLLKNGKWETRDAINNPGAGTIILNQDRMKELGARSHEEQMAFTLHEWLRFLRIEDEHYEVSGPFLAKLKKENELEALRKDLAARVRKIVESEEETRFLRQNLNIEALLTPVELSSDYATCNSPQSSQAQINVSCMNVATMIQGSVTQMFPTQSSVGTNLLIESYFAAADALPRPGDAKFARALGNFVLKGMDTARSEFQAKFAGVKSRVLRCKGIGDDALPCAVRTMRQGIKTDIPPALKQAYLDCEKTLADALDLLERYHGWDYDLPATE